MKKQLFSLPHIFLFCLFISFVFIICNLSGNVQAQGVSLVQRLSIHSSIYQGLSKLLIHLQKPAVSLQNRRTEFESSSDAEKVWSLVGPGNFGGRTRALIIHPNDPNVMYAGGARGGIWKSNDGGLSWALLNNQLPNQSICALAFDPKNPNVIYAGTGEGFFNSDALPGIGIFRSTDAGLTWTLLDTTTTSDFQYVNKIIISPNNSQRIYVATRKGIWRSFDAGASWEQAYDPLLTGGCLDMVIRTDKTSDLIIASFGIDGIPGQYFRGSVIYRNLDASGPGPWELMYTDSSATRISLAIAPSSQDTVYAAVSTWNGALKAILRSMNSGDYGSWTTQTSLSNPNKLNSLLFADIHKAYAQECNNGSNQYDYRGKVNNAIAVDPTDANRVWVGCYELFRSDDAGVNWGLASYSWLSPTSQHYVHVGQHSIIFHPQYNGNANKTLFVSGDGGIFKTDDARAVIATSTTAPCQPSENAVTWTSLNNYPTTQFGHGAVSPDGKSYLGSVVRTGVIAGSDMSNNWKKILDGEIGFVAIDPQNPDTFYVDGLGIPIMKSTNGGVTFQSSINGMPSSIEFSQATLPFTIDPSDPHRLWIGGRTAWRSDNGATKWVQINKGFLSGSSSAIAVSPTNANFVLIGMAEGNISRTESGLLANQNSDWQNTLPRSGNVSSIIFDPTNHNIAYATYSVVGGNHVWKSIDAGTSWSAIDGQGANALPNTQANSIVIDPTNTQRLFVGTESGVFTTTDGGSNWIAVNQGLGNPSVKWLTISNQVNDTTLYAFTNGYSLWRLKIANGGCTYSLAESEKSYSKNGGVGSIKVNGPQVCNWAAKSNEGWITINGYSNGEVSYSVAPSDVYTPRIGIITVAGLSYVIRQEAKPDTIPPTISITSPLNTGSFSTSVPRVTISGIASDNLGISEVTLTSDRHIGVYTATGTTSWSITNLGLPSGVTNITVTARDTVGYSSSATIRIVFTPLLSFYKVAGTGIQGFSGDGGQANLAKISGGNIAFDKADNLYFADTANNCIRKITPTGIISTVAGTGVAGLSGDGGPATLAQMSNPRSVAVDSTGNIIIVDGNNNGLLRRVDATTGIISRVSYTGGQFFQISDATVDDNGNIYVVDSVLFKVVKISPDGQLTTVAGGGTNQRSDGLPATSIQLLNLRSIALDKFGNIYFAELGGASKVTPDGKYYAVAPQIRASRVNVDAEGNVYLSDENTWQIYRVSADKQITTIAGGGNLSSKEGLISTLASLGTPGKVAFNSKGTLYFSELTKFVIWKLSSPPVDTTPPALTVSTPTTDSNNVTTSSLFYLTGTVTDDSEATQVICQNDRGVTFGASDSASWSSQLIILQPGLNTFTVTAWDQAGNSTKKVINVTFNPSNVAVTLAANGQLNNVGENTTGAKYQITKPTGIATDQQGNVYFADTVENRVSRISREGVITTIAGNGLSGFSGDGGPAIKASLNEPRGIAIDQTGNVYISDSGNHRIRRVSPDGIIITIAGTGLPGDGGNAEQAVNSALNYPIGLAMGSAKELYLADTRNHRLRKLVLTTGLIFTVSGTGVQGFEGDGGKAGLAKLNYPGYLTIDSIGNILISDTGNNRVRRITTDGIIDTLRWNPNNISLNQPTGIAVDALNNVYIADSGNNVIRKVTPTGIITTEYGLFTARYLPNLAAGSISLGNTMPLGIAFDAAGNLYTSEPNASRISVISPYKSATTALAASYATQATNTSIVSVFGAALATSTQSAITLPLPTKLGGTIIKVRDSLGTERLAPLFYVSPLQINYLIPDGTAPGFATVIVINSNGVASSGAVEITSISPGIFSANSNGQGAAVAIALHVGSDNSRRYEEVVDWDAKQNLYITRPLDLGPEGESLYLELYGTGIRDWKTGVSATIGGEPAEVLYAGITPGFVGLDQVNVKVPRSLAGRGEVDIKLLVDGKESNKVTINIK